MPVRTDRAEETENVERGNETRDSAEKAQFKVGDRVRLPQYGEGKVDEVEADSLIVRFPSGRARKFKSEFARPVRRSVQKR
jgi:hypothetical protein